MATLDSPGPRPTSANFIASPEFTADTLSYVTEGMDLSIADSLESDCIEDFEFDNLQDDNLEGRVDVSGDEHWPPRHSASHSSMGTSAARRSAGSPAGAKVNNTGTPASGSNSTAPPAAERTKGTGLHVVVSPEEAEKNVPSVLVTPEPEAPAALSVGLPLGAPPATSSSAKAVAAEGGSAAGGVPAAKVAAPRFSVAIPRDDIETASIESGYTSNGGLDAEMEEGAGLASSSDPHSANVGFTSTSGGEDEASPKGGDSFASSGDPYARPSGVPPKSKAEMAKHKKEHALMLKLLEKKAKEESKEMEEKDRKMAEKERRMAESIQTWKNEILPKWEKCLGKKKMRQLYWMGIPPRIRTDVWPKALGNSLHISQDLYDIFRTRAREKAKEAEAQALLLNEKGGGGDVAESTDLNTSKEASVALIALDLPRTFPALSIFGPGGPMNGALRDVLETYVCYRPDVGYGQGMSYVAAMLLLYMDSFEAFVAMANVLNKPMFLSFYRVDLSEIYEYLAVFETLFEERLPKLYKHFKALAIKPDVYMIDWVLTLFTKSLPLDVAARVWDNYIFDGDVFLFRTALGVLHMYTTHLLSLDFGDAMVFLTHLPKDMDDGNLFKSIEAVPIQQKKFDQLLAKVRSVR